MLADDLGDLILRVGLFLSVLGVGCLRVMGFSGRRMLGRLLSIAYAIWWGSLGDHTYSIVLLFG